MVQRVVIYARYSSDLQSDASIEDQIRLCSERAQSEKWSVVNSYMDAGISGASLMRPGIQSLLQAAMNGEFDILLSEALDRLSRDQEDIAGIYKRMEFAGVKIITLSEGEISTLHIGLKGTMNAMFLKDLADKTRRGLRGKVENGKSGGGLAYGYKVAKHFDGNGEAIKGDREIDPVQADIVRRIFQEYAHNNKSPKAIAAELNLAGIPSPSGKDWGQSAINGNRRRGSGILNNSLYIGKLIWNRQRFIKDPMTGKRVTRLNERCEWVIHDVPDLAIVPQELWEAAKARQKELDKKKPALWQTNRPQYLLSGLTKCGVCGGGYSKINSTQYGCSAAKNKGSAVCTNRKTIKRELLEGTVLGALQTHLMRDELLDVFADEYTRHMSELNKSHNANAQRYRAELAKLGAERENLIQAIKDGVPASMIKGDLERVSVREAELEELLKAKGEEKPLIHPKLASRYRSCISNLRESLNRKGSRSQAAQHLRAMVDKIVLTPKEDAKTLQIDLYGDLAGIINIASENNTMNNDPTLLEKLCLYERSEAPVDRIGSGGRI